jgi:hypothetical protein
MSSHNLDHGDKKRRLLSIVLIVGLAWITYMGISWSPPSLGSTMIASSAKKKNADD